MKITEYVHKTYHRILLEKLLRAHSSQISGAVLDIGSKNRRYDHLFHATITAVDITPNNEKNVLQGDVEKGIDLPDESFDGILCIEVFEYLDKYEQAIHEIYRLLKKNGVALVSIPFVYNDHQDNLRFTEGLLRKKFGQFRSVDVSRIGNGYVVIWDILRKKVYSANNRLLRTLLFLLISPYLLFIKLFNLEKKRDDYYSGVFLILKK